MMQRLRNKEAHDSFTQALKAKNRPPHQARDRHKQQGEVKINAVISEDT